MKSILLIITFLFSTNLFAQWGAGAVKLGYFTPSATGGGFIIGYEGGKYFDEGFNLGWSIDWFHKNYTDKKLVSEFNDVYGIASGSINELRAKTSIHDFPLMASITVKFPAAPFTRIYLTGGIGAEVLLISYKNFLNPQEDKLRAAFDFNWRIGAGVSYEVGRRSEFFGELAYHSSAPSWQYEVDDPATKIKRTFERSYDMSGIMMRVGVRFYY